MNIDLLFTEDGEAGLISNKNLVKKAAGALYDPQSGIFTLEYVDMDFLDFNIPVDAFYNPYLDRNEFLHLGSVKDGHIGQAYQVPLMFTDDPYRNQNLTGEAPENALSAFDYFVRNAIAGQPVYRTDLGDEDAMGCVLGDASPSSLEFAPHLARQHGLEAQPTIAPINAPGMGLGGSTSGGGYVQKNGQDKSRSQNRRGGGISDKRRGDKDGA